MEIEEIDLNLLVAFSALIDCIQDLLRLLRGCRQIGLSACAKYRRHGIDEHIRV